MNTEPIVKPVEEKPEKAFEETRPQREAPSKIGNIFFGLVQLGFWGYVAYIVLTLVIGILTAVAGLFVLLTGLIIPVAVIFGLYLLIRHIAGKNQR